MDDTAIHQTADVALDTDLSDEALDQGGGKGRLRGCDQQANHDRVFGKDPSLRG